MQKNTFLLLADGLLPFLAAPGHADVTVSIGLLANDTSVVVDPDFVPTANNLLSGKLPDSHPPRVGEGALTPIVLTDGAVGVKSAFCFCFNAGAFTYSLGSSPTGYDVSAINLYGGWVAGGWRGHIHLTSIQYTLAKELDLWVTLPESVNKLANPSANKVNYIRFVESGGGAFLSGVMKIRANLAVCNNGYHALNEIEAGGTPSAAPDYYEITGYTVSNRTTGSTAFVNTNVAGVAGLTKGYASDKWVQTEDAGLSSSTGATWTSTDAMPATQTFATPPADTNLNGYTWFTHSADSAYVLRRSPSSTIRHTTAKPVVSVKSPLSLTMFAGDQATVTVNGVDNGTTGGESSGDGMATLAIPVYSRKLEKVTGPGEDLDGDGATVTLAVAGSYTLRFTVMNAAGNEDSATVSLTLAEIEPGPVVWQGGASSDWNEAANWAPTVVPRAGDTISIPAGSTFSPMMQPGTYPASGSYAGMTVASEGTLYEPGRYPAGSAESPADVTLNQSFAYVFPASAGMHYWNLSVANGVHAEIHGGQLNLGDFELGGTSTLMFGSWYTGGPADVEALVFDSIALTNTLNLAGVIDANPGFRATTAQCTASGGAVWIQAAHFTGGGSILSKSTSGRRYGAGGRIAIEAVDNQFSGTVDCGLDGYQSDNKSYPGTIFLNAPRGVDAFGWVGQSGPVLSSSYSISRTSSAVLTITSSASTSGNALVFDRTVVKWRPGEASFIWTEGCYMKKAGTALANTVTYSLSNLPASEKFAIALNGEPVTQGGGNLYASDAAGTLTFPVTLGTLADEISVRPNSSFATVILVR